MCESEWTEWENLISMWVDIIQLARGPDETKGRGKMHSHPLSLLETLLLSSDIRTPHTLVHMATSYQKLFSSGTTVTNKEKTTRLPAHPRPQSAILETELQYFSNIFSTFQATITSSGTGDSRNWVLDPSE